MLPQQIPLAQPARLLGAHGVHRVVGGTLSAGHLDGLQGALLEDLLDDLLLVLRVKLGSKGGLGRGVELALGALLVGEEDLEGRDKVRQRDAGVALPALERLNVVDKDDEVVVAALEVDLVLGSLAASHCVVLVGVWSGKVECV